MVLVEGAPCVPTCLHRQGIPGSRLQRPLLSDQQPVASLTTAGRVRASHRWSISGIAAPPPTRCLLPRGSRRDTLAVLELRDCTRGEAAEPAVRVSSWGLYSPAMIPQLIENCQIAFSHSS